MMKQNELVQIMIGIIVMTLIVGGVHIFNSSFDRIGIIFLFSFIIIWANVLSKKFIANQLDADVEHEIWRFYRYGFKPTRHFKKPLPFGVIVPLSFALLSLGSLKVYTILTYQTKALKRRAARRFGAMSFTEMTDFHNALVGGAGIIAVLIVAFLGYWFQPISDISRLAIIYAFFNMIPFSKLDGSQIFFGSRVLWVTLAVITLIFTGYALFLI